MAVIAPVVGRRGRVSDSRMNAYLEGGPELMAKLHALDLKVRKQVGADALKAAGRVIADEWARLAPVGVAPHDSFPGSYRKSLEMEESVRAKGSKWGALGSVQPAVVPGVPEGEQPRLYAAKLEFVHGEPSCRPAFDSSKMRATEALSESLRDALDPRRVG